MLWSHVEKGPPRTTKWPHQGPKSTAPWSWNCEKGILLMSLLACHSLFHQEQINTDALVVMTLLTLYSFNFLPVSHVTLLHTQLSLYSHQYYFLETVWSHLCSKYTAIYYQYSPPHHSVSSSIIRWLMVDTSNPDLSPLPDDNLTHLNWFNHIKSKNPNLDSPYPLQSLRFFQYFCFTFKWW